MPVSMQALGDDRVAETTALRELISELDEDGWRRDTPATGWTVAEQVSHLAHFDDAAVQSAADPAASRRELARIESEGENDPDRLAEPYRNLSGNAVLAWFDDARSRLVGIFRALDPSLRVPWFGPLMSAASSLTACFMETWAHGQDIADALGVGARTYSYTVNGLPVPEEPVHVELAALEGSTWTWRPSDAPDRVTGHALQFCLAVTQRRHLDDLDLTIAGGGARQWMAIAQAFAGGVGRGRSRPALTARARAMTDDTTDLRGCVPAPLIPTARRPV